MEEAEAGVAGVNRRDAVAPHVKRRAGQGGAAAREGDGVITGDVVGGENLRPPSAYRREEPEVLD